MPTDPTENPDDPDCFESYRLRRERARELERELEQNKEREKTEDIFVQIICVQHMLVCWYLQAGFDHRLRHSEILSFDAIYGDYERAYGCTRSSPSMHRKLGVRLERLMESYLRVHSRHESDEDSFNTARKALEMPHKMLMPAYWDIEKRLVEKYLRSYHDNLLRALDAKRRLIEDLNGLHTDKR